jgi:hypothetical protein
MFDSLNWMDFKHWNNYFNYVFKISNFENESIFTVRVNGLLLCKASKGGLQRSLVGLPVYRFTGLPVYRFTAPLNSLRL